MKHKWLMILAIIIMLSILFLLVALGVIQKPFATLMVNGRTIATVHRSLLGPLLGDSSTDIYSEKEKVFSLHQDFWDCPEFIYPLADGKRFLCDYWADTA